MDALSVILGMLLGWLYCILSHFLIAPVFLYLSGNTTLDKARLARARWWAHHPELTGPAIFVWVLLALLFLVVR